jgi:hypothetical protein
MGGDHTNIAAACRKDKRGRYIHSAAAEGNIWGESWNALKPSSSRNKEFYSCLSEGK